MADPPDGLLGNLSNLFPGNNPAALYGGLLSDPATQAQFNQRALAAMAGSFADSAMPTRMPTPLGAVLGHAAAAGAASGDPVMAARLQEAQSEQARATAYLSQQRGNVMGQIAATQQQFDAGAGGGGGIPAPAAPGAPGTTAGSVPGKAPTGPIDPALLTAAANANNLDPLVAHTTMDIESSYGTNTGNPKSPSNTGAFQMAKADAPGGQNDTYENQVGQGVGALAMARNRLRTLLGREPTNAEIYLAHQQGPDGAAALINNPDTPAGKLTRPINISNNGGQSFVNAPASAFVQHWADIYAQHEAKFGHIAASQPSAAPGPGQTAAAPSQTPGLLDLPDPTGATARLNAPLPGIAPPGAQANASGLGPSPQNIGAVNVGASSLVPPGQAQAPPPGPAVPPPVPGPAVPPGGAGALLPPRAPNLVAGGAGGPPSGLLGPNAGIPSPNIPPLPPAPPRPPAPPPTPLVTSPAPTPAVPAITQPQPPPAAPVPGAPSPERIALAQRLAHLYIAAGLPVPPDVEATSKFALTAAAEAEAMRLKLPYTPMRPYSSFPVTGPDGRPLPGYQAPGPPLTVAGPPDAEGRPTTRLVRPSTIPGVPSTQEPLGATGPSPAETQFPQTGTIPGNPIGPRGTLQGGTVIDPTKPIPSPANAGRSWQTTIPAIDKQPPMSDWPTYGKAAPDWLKTSAQIADAGVTAERAETNLTAIAKAYQMVESGTWATGWAEFGGYLKALGLPFSGDAKDLANLQIALHNNYKQTLSTLKAANSKFTGNEFKINSDAGEAAGNQPAANLTLLSQDIAQVRQIQGFATDWNRAQGMIGDDGRKWNNPDSFTTAWRDVNPLQPQIDLAKTQFPVKGTPGAPGELPSGPVPAPRAGPATIPPDFPKGTTYGGTSNGRPFYVFPDGSRHW